MVTCDARQCPARATREIWYDNGGSLFGCAHHTFEWCPWLTDKARFDHRDLLILGAED